MGSAPPGGYSIVTIKTSVPGISVRSFDISEVALASCAITVPVERNSSTIRSFIFLKIDPSFLACVRFIRLPYRCEYTTSPEPNLDDGIDRYLGVSRGEPAALIHQSIF